MLTDLLLATLQICGIVILIGLMACFVGAFIDFFFGDKKK